MGADEQINYRLIGEFLAKCGALEFEVDFILFAAAGQYKERLTGEIKKWPQQASDKFWSLIWLIKNLMQFPPTLTEHGFSNFDTLAKKLDRIYHVRNLLSHGTIVQGFGPEPGMILSKATRKPDEAHHFSFAREFVSDREMHELISSLSAIILLVDNAMFGLRRERGGWLPSDTSGLAPSIKLKLINMRSSRESLAVKVFQEGGST